MLRLVLLVISSLGVLANYQFYPLNTLWEGNDKLLVTLDFIYERLAGPITNDGCNPHRRSFSIIAQAIIRYIRNPNITLQKVLKKMKKLLKEPADVIAANVRSDLNLVRAIIDKPINDIKKNCKPNTTKVECDKKFLYHTAVHTLKCPFYLNHVKLREDLQSLVLAQDFQNLLEEAVKVSVEGTDKTAIDFFANSVRNKKKVLEKMGKIYQKYKHNIFPCMYIGRYPNWQKIMCSTFNK